jgi:pyrroline-5-carboxylate reductase
MSCSRVAIIGGGNLGAAVAEGILKMQVLEADKLYITRRRTHQLNHLKERGVNVVPSNVDAAAACDLIILAIKPYQVVDVIKEIKPALTAQKTLVSLVSGVSSEVLQKAAGSDIPVFRAMPNTAIGLGQSMTCISFDKPWADRLPVVEELFNQLGETAVINEELMAAATVLGSCGIAFALRFMRAAMQGGIEIGFSAEMAQLITAQTMKGASELILSSKAHPEREIDRVTTPMGITISGLNEMEHQGFSSSLIQGLITSYRKIEKSK